jgi:DNA (cytosine-5)-methyltransferase 1
MIQAVDLFCGAGGTSSGLYAAADSLGLSVNLLAINHWSTAIKTHRYNHKEATHLCESLDNVNPRTAVTGGRLHLLVASPECTHHSNARGGVPCADQSRASAWHVLRWCEALRVENVLVENVPEFEHWGPLGSNGRPLKSRRGETFQGWVAALRSLNYRVEWRVLNAADYGDATCRRRLFVMARKGNRKIAWPQPTHAPTANGKQPWRPAREIIDWDYPSQSIFERTRPLAEKTIRRIEHGLRKFGGDAAEPFLVVLRGTGNSRGLDRPLPAVTAKGTHLGLCEPFLMHATHAGAERCHSLGQPLPTVTCAHRGELALVQPFLLKIHGGQRWARAQSVDEPLRTLDTQNRFALCQPFITTIDNGSSDPESTVQSVDRPLSTIIASNPRHALCQPFLTKYYGTSAANSVDLPLDTLTTKERFGLCQPLSDGDRMVDIHFRMLQPHELAAAMGMEGFTFVGTKGDVVKQIGNAVPHHIAKALCTSALRRFGSAPAQ